MESDENFSDDNEEQKDEVIKVPSIIVDSCHKLTEVMKLLGKACKYKKMSIGTKIIANTLREYDDIIIKLESVLYTPGKGQQNIKAYAVWFDKS